MKFTQLSNVYTLKPFSKYLNTLIPSIQFTVEKEHDNTITFLDVQITRNNKTLETIVYQKPTHSNRYLHFKSHHPLTQKISIAHTLHNRSH